MRITAETSATEIAAAINANRAATQGPAMVIGEHLIEFNGGRIWKTDHWQTPEFVTFDVTRERPVAWVWDYPGHRLVALDGDDGIEFVITPDADS